MWKTSKVFAIVLPVMVAMLLVQAAYAQSVNSGSTGGAPSGSGALSLQALTLSPQYVVSGENATISFQLFNSYSGTLQNVNLQLEASNPLLNVSPSDTNLIGVVGSGIYGGSGFDIYTYKIHIPSTLQSGIYTIDVVATYETSVSNGVTSYDTPGESVMPISIYVHGKPGIGFSLAPSSQIVPNSDMQFEVDAHNSGTGTAYNVTATIDNSTYFKPSGAEELILGTMAAGASYSSAASVFVASNITNGTHSVKLTLSYQDENGTYVHTNTSVPIAVLLNSPDIIAAVQSTQPSQLYVGANQSVEVAVENVGSGTARNVSVSFRSGSGAIVGSAAASFFISSLQPGQSVPETITVSSNQSEPSSVAHLYASLSYEGANYAGNYSKVVPINLSVFPSAVFSITSVQGSLQPGATYKPVAYTIKNVGNEPASQVSLSLQSIYPITPISGNAYIDSLAPNQSTTVTFYVDVDSNGADGSYPATIYEQWRQPNGAISQQFSGSNSYYMAVGGKQYAPSGTQPSGSPANYSGYAYAAIAVIVVAVLAFLAINMRSKRSSRSKMQKSAEVSDAESEKHGGAKKRK